MSIIQKVRKEIYMSGKIKELISREILDSRGNPTLETSVILEDGTIGTASVPSGASTGAHEAHERRDGGERYGGRGVMGAVRSVMGECQERIVGMHASDGAAIDAALISLDGTKNKTGIGANAILSISLAAARAAAIYEGIALYEYLSRGKRTKSLPVPMLNILNGGAHASNNVEIQEFMIVPTGIEAFPEMMRAAAEIYAALGKILNKNGYSRTVGDEGGYAPSLRDDEMAIELIVEAIETAGYSTDKVKLALDVASSEWAASDKYIMTKSGREYFPDELIAYYAALIKKYPIISIEDGLGEDDFTGWERLTERLGGKIMLVGDDLFVTNEARLRTGIGRKIANAILIKPNQIGTLTETLSVIERAKHEGYSHIISHRSGETSDTFIADLAVATGAPFIKAGAPARGERVAKYNRLLEIYGENE